MASKLKFTKTYPEFKIHKIGDFTYGRPTLYKGPSKLTIGKYCSIASGTMIFLGGNHRPDWITTYPLNLLFEDFSITQASTKGDVYIGNDVWLGHDSVIMSGVTIGDGAVVAAKAVVTKNVEPYSIVAGNPAKHVKYRFNKEQREMLLELKWWDFNIKVIKQIYPMLMSENIVLLYNKFKKVK